MNRARELAEQIVLASRQDRYSKATVFEDFIESLISEALDEAVKEAQGTEALWEHDKALIEAATEDAKAQEREEIAKIIYEHTFEVSKVGTSVGELLKKIRQRGEGIK